MRDWELEKLSGNRIFLKQGVQKKLFEVARQRMGWTKLQMAGHLGISDTAIYNYEKEDSRRHPTWEIIEKALTLVPELKEEILSSIYETKPLHWGSQKGMNIVNTKYADKLAEWGKSGGRKSIRLMAERYPDKLQEWRRAAGRKGAQVLHTIQR